jgi:hypothetical protein
MIIATELRLYNLLNYDTGEGVFATKIDIHDLAWCVRDEKGFNVVHFPIPITEEWLLRLGFEFKNDGYFVIEIGRQSFIVSEAQDDDLVLLYSEDVGLPHNFLKFIEHIHELQNIIFFLTNEELKLKD